MIEFKKWLLTDEGQILVGDKRAEAAWKAALEWMLGNLGHSIEHKEIADMIEQELQE